MGKFHKVKSHYWANGELQTEWNWFDSIDDAKDFAENIIGVDTVKVYTDSDELVHSLTTVTKETYA